MSGRIIPETSNRQDWPRLVAQGHRDHEGRIKALEAGGGSSISGGFTMDDGTATASGGFTLDEGGA